MANIKQFTIKINGIQESIDGIEALSNKLNALDLQINKERKIEVEVTMPQTPSQQTNGTTTSSSGGRNNSGLSEEAKLQNQIIQNAEKITAARTNDYQVLLRQKETLKDINVQQKANVAETALQTKEYANTMQGLKQELADIKQVMQTTDLADDKFKDLVGRAGQLTQKLKDIEAEYGTFGRNVGNYASAAEGFKNFSIEVAGATQEFDNAKQALMELKKEMQTLSAKKDMGLISDEEAERLKSLIPTVKELESSIKDAGKPMDALMDTMQSVVAIAQAGKGLSALFGLDDNKIEESIQKLVALQNVMQSLQTMQKQMQTGEGIGGWLTKANVAIDAMSKKLLGATKAAKGLSMAIKGIGLGVVVGAVMLLVDAFNDMEEAEKKAEEEAEKLKKKIEEQRQTFVNASAQYNNTASRISYLRSEYIKTNDQLKKTSILKEASNEFKKLGISINSVSDAQRVLVEQGNDVIELLKLQGNAAALSAMRMEAYKKSFNMLLENGYDVSMASTLASYNSMVVQFDSEMDKINTKMTELQKKLNIGDFSNKVKENSDKTLDAVKKAQENINELTLKLMSDGLYKELKRLDENNRKEIDKIKQNGEKVEEQLKLQYKVYEKEQKKLFDRYIKDIEKSNTSFALKNQIDQVKLLREQWEKMHLVMNRATSTMDAPLFGLSDSPEAVKKLIEQYKSWTELYNLRNDELGKNNWKAYFEALKKDYLPKAAKEIQDEFYRLLEVERPDSFDGLIDGDVLITSKNQKDAYNYLKKSFEEETAELKYFLTKYQGEVQIGEKGIYQTLEKSYEEREKLTKERFKDGINTLDKFINENLALIKEGIDNEEKLEKEANEERLKNTREGYEKLISKSQKYSGYTSVSVADLLRGKEESGLTEEEKTLQNFVKLIDEYEKEATQITIKYQNQRKAAEFDTNNQRQKNNFRYYEQEITNLEDFLQKASNIVDKQPEYNKLGFIDVKKTKAQYKEVIDLYEQMSKKIKQNSADMLVDWNNGNINGEQYDAAMNNLEFYKKKLEETIADTEEKMKELGPEIWKSINEWIQQIGQAANQIMSSFSEITSNHYEKQIEEQEKYIEKYEELLDKQKEATQEYADAVDEIEDELSTSRGDRRQQLIDALNAELAAQRASLAEEKRIEKEKERAEEKKKKLEHDQAVAEKKMSVWQARLNAVMAVSMAAVNKWPIPAIPMMALAAAVGAAQIAAAESQNIPSYGEGGIIQGKSHREGGVKAVVGGRQPIELEGKEYIIRKSTATENINLLDYINKSQRKLNLNDFIEFYSGNKVKNSITRVSPKHKYADGGTVIPSLRTDIDLSDRMLTAFEDYSQRPVVVSVVDIQNATDRVNQVRVMSGLVE